MQRARSFPGPIGDPVCTVALLCSICLSVCTASAAESSDYDPSRLEYSILSTGLVRPMEFVVANDRTIYYIELDGKLKRFDPGTEQTELIAEIKVTTEQENGLIGIALDPNFDSTQWIYLQYSPPDFPGQHISRFTLSGNQLDLASEKVLFRFEEQRKECCHHAGSMAFGPDGCLYIGTGDNTHPHGDSQGYAPIDERPDRAPWDAQKSAANSRSGSGKILRIKPTPDGSYEVPDGNLFPKDGSKGLAEIYVMGCRNPWRISVDSKSGFVYWGEVGPDAGGDGLRGPQGYDELNQAKAAGNFGWPYFIANNRPYADVDYATGKVGALFDPAHPVNESPNNTGTRELPAAQPALLYYPYGASAEFPELGQGGRTACAGPVYHFDSSLTSTTKFPQNFDNVLFFYEWTRNWIKAVHLNADGSVKKIEPFMPQQRFVRPIDMQFGPDGALYLIEYGETWGVNKDARLVRIDYASGNRKPVARAAVSNNVGKEPLEVAFSSEGTLDKDPQDKLTYEWRAIRAGDPAATPNVISHEANPRITFREPGIFTVELIVSDVQGARSAASVPVVVGNARPSITLLHPIDGDFYDPTQPVAYRIHVRDEEDGTSDADEADAQDLEFLDPDAPSRVTLNATLVAPGADGDADNQGPPGMRLMKGSDCFNCHAIDQKRVGPPLLEIANKYRGQPHALEASVKRVREGSSGVWGKIPMIPHAQHTDDELHKMVSWIYSLEAASGLRVFQGFVGEVPAAASDADPAGHLSLEATYIDRGTEGIPPLSSSVKVTLRSRRLDAELANEIHGPRILESPSAHGRKFLGSIDHGHNVKISGVSLDDVSSLTLRVASAGAGGQIEVHLDKPDGPLLAVADVAVNGQWENWYDRTINLKRTSGKHDLWLVFSNEKSRSALMNLDSVYFHP